MAEVEFAERPLEPARRGRRSIDWVDDGVLIVDQCALPHAHRHLRLDTVDDVIAAITRLAVRGAPAIGVAGALGVALSARQHARAGDDPAAVRDDAERLIAARPTAVNLEWGARRALGRLEAGAEVVLAEALAMLDEDEQINVAAARRAADLLLELCGQRVLSIATHCNTGRLATVAEGTALGAIKSLARRDRVATVLVGETRPLLQGARLTTWELAEAGIPHRLCVDSALPAAIARGMVDCVVVGADRVAANGDVANKIGTYSLAVAAARQGVPFVVVAPESSIDRRLADGALIVIEERAASEVLELAGRPTAATGTAAYNPAFDVTPAELITAVVSEAAVYVGSIDGAAPAVGHDDLGARIAQHVRVVRDGDDESVDLSFVYARAWLTRRLTAAVAAVFGGRVDQVLAVDARSSVFGALVAEALERPLAAPGEPVAGADGRRQLATVDGELLAGPGGRVLLVSDVLAGGDALVDAAHRLERNGATVAGVATILELRDRRGRAALEPLRVFAARSA